MTKHATLLGSAADGAATQGVHDARVNVRAATQGVLDRRVDQRPTYSPRLVREAEEQAMISKDIDAAEESRALFDRSVDRRVERLSRSPKNFRYIVMVLHRVRGQQRDQRTTCRPSQLLASVASSLLPNLCYLLPSPRRFKHR